MTIELDSWDRDWLSRHHTVEEYQRMCKELLERCAAYAAQIEELKSARAPVVRSPCDYPACTDLNFRCARLMRGECSGPRTGGG